jgi:hypothetical protein
VGAVLVAGHDHAGDLAHRDHAAGVVGLGQERVAALEHAPGDRAGVAEPDGRPDDEDVAGQDALADLGPLVAVTHVRLDARRDVP